MLNATVLGSNTIMNNKDSLTFPNILFLPLNVYVSFFHYWLFATCASTNKNVLLPTPNIPQQSPIAPNISQHIIQSWSYSLQKMLDNAFQTWMSSLQHLLCGWLIRASNIFSNIFFGAAKKFFRHEYEYEYIIYIDYTRTYIKYQNIV